MPFDRTDPEDCDEFVVPPKGGLHGVVRSDPHADACSKQSFFLRIDWELGTARDSVCTEGRLPPRVDVLPL